MPTVKPGDRVIVGIGIMGSPLAIVCRTVSVRNRESKLCRVIYDGSASWSHVMYRVLSFRERLSTELLLTDERVEVQAIGLRRLKRLNRKK